MQIHAATLNAETSQQADHKTVAPFLRGEGLPSSRSEHWRMTPISRLYDRQYQAIETSVATLEAMRQAVQEYVTHWQVVSQRLVVLCDGLWQQELSDFPACTLSLDNLPTTDYHRLPFMGQNHAVATPITHIVLAQDLGSSPLHVLCLSSGAPTLASFGKLHITAKAEASAVLVESHVSLPHVASQPYDHYVNQWVALDVQQGARLSHYKCQQLDDHVLHIAATHAQIAEKAHYDGFVLHLGGQQVRHDHEMIIHGSQAHASINGAYIGTGSQHIDNTSQIQHAAPESTSREVFKGVLADKAKGVFQARIHVHQVAQLTDAYQMNRALLLSPLAEINAKPELEIYADDVKCSHGATVGELDSDQLFYLTSRGISRTNATTMLIEAYLEDVFEGMGNQACATIFASLAREKLHTIAMQMHTE